MALIFTLSMITTKQIKDSVKLHGSRNGDLRFKPVSTIPSGLTKSTDNVVAYGEATNHAHRLVGAATVYQGEGDKTYFEVNGECEIQHEDHKPYPLPVGKFEIVNEREYEPFTEAIKKVQD